MGLNVSHETDLEIASPYTKAEYLFDSGNSSCVAWASGEQGMFCVSVWCSFDELTHVQDLSTSLVNTSERTCVKISLVFLSGWIYSSSMSRLATPSPLVFSPT